LDSLTYFYNLNVKDNMNKRIKELAKKSEPDVAKALKVAAVDMLDEFGL
jgi:hypothetical protein